MEGVLNEREFRYTRADFERSRALIARIAGIALSSEKREFVYSRLARLVRSDGLHSIGELLDRVESSPEEFGGPFVNALTTNLTSFFREPHHFQALVRLAHARAEPLRVWSAACSTGEEPYSIAITLWNEGVPAGRLLASDVDSEVLRRAAAAIYPSEAVSHVPEAVRRRWFLRGTGPNEGRVRVVRSLRDRVEFRKINLVDQPKLGERFDAIFCRNVFIYFDHATQRRVLERFFDVLSPGSLLMTGHAENLLRSADLFERVGTTTYARQ